MNEQQAKAVAEGQRVVFSGDLAKGSVVERGYSAFKVKWDDGKHGVYPFDRAQDVEVLK